MKKETKQRIKDLEAKIEELESKEFSEGLLSGNFKSEDFNPENYILDLYTHDTIESESVMFWEEKQEIYNNGSVKITLSEAVNITLLGKLSQDVVKRIKRYLKCKKLTSIELLEMLEKDSKFGYAVVSRLSGKGICAWYSLRLDIDTDISYRFIEIDY